jgi:hypothetical protein
MSDDGEEKAGKGKGDAKKPKEKEKEKAKPKPKAKEEDEDEDAALGSASSGDEGPGAPAKGKAKAAPDAKAKLPAAVVNGAQFIRHAAGGAAKPVFVCLSRTHIFLGKKKEDAYKDREANKTKEAVALKDVRRVLAGKASPVFKGEAGDGVSERLCFSVVYGGDKTLDLQASSREEADLWTMIFKDIIAGNY